MVNMSRCVVAERLSIRWKYEDKVSSTADRTTTRVRLSQGGGAKKFTATPAAHGMSDNGNFLSGKSHPSIPSSNNLCEIVKCVLSQLRRFTEPGKVGDINSVFALDGKGTVVKILGTNAPPVNEHEGFRFLPTGSIVCENNNFYFFTFTVVDRDGGHSCFRCERKYHCTISSNLHLMRRGNALWCS